MLKGLRCSLIFEKFVHVSKVEPLLTNLNYTEAFLLAQSEKVQVVK
jgi:hypothetical protein